MPDPSKRTIFLMRHAQAASSATDDKSRPLTPKGADDAAKAGTFMKEKNYHPDLVLCSPAKRTQETLAHLNKTLEIMDIQYPEILYSGSIGDYVSLIQHCDDRFTNIMIIGHNPSIYGLVSMLAGDGADSAMQRLSEGYAPASISVLETTLPSWTEIQPHENTLVDYANPLDFNAPSGPSRWM